MPDLVTHTATAWIGGRRTPLWRHRGMLLLGAVLPDLISRPFYLLWPATFWSVSAWHSPLACFLVALWISALFPTHEQGNVLKALGLGLLLHFALDATQKHVLVSYWWFFPFSWWSYEDGLLWPEQWLGIAPWLAGVAILLELSFVLRQTFRSRRGGQ